MSIEKEPVKPTEFFTEVTEYSEAKSLNWPSGILLACGISIIAFSLYLIISETTPEINPETNNIVELVISKLANIKLENLPISLIIFFSGLMLVIYGSKLLSVKKTKKKGKK